MAKLAPNHAAVTRHSATGSLAIFAAIRRASMCCANCRRPRLCRMYETQGSRLKVVGEHGSV